MAWRSQSTIFWSSFLLFAFSLGNKSIAVIYHIEDIQYQNNTDTDHGDERIISALMNSKEETTTRILNMQTYRNANLNITWFIY